MPAIITPEEGEYAPINNPMIAPVLRLNTNEPDCPGLVCMFIVAYLDFIPEVSSNILAPISVS